MVGDVMSLGMLAKAVVCRRWVRYQYRGEVMCVHAGQQVGEGKANG